MKLQFRCGFIGGALKVHKFAIGGNFYWGFHFAAKIVKNQMMFNDDDYCKSLPLSIGFICISLTIYD